MDCLHQSRRTENSSTIEIVLLVLRRHLISLCAKLDPELLRANPIRLLETVIKANTQEGVPDDLRVCG